MDPALELLLDEAEVVFVAIYTLEMVLKISSGPRWYFSLGSNRFDCVITVVSLFDVVVNLALSHGFADLAAVHKRLPPCCESLEQIPGRSSCSDLYI